MSYETMMLFENTKEPYYVPSMAERLAIQPNGLVAVSTFSGCGGSSLGLKTAGFTIPYAVEFTPQGAATYRANFPTTHVDERDIREIKPEEILEHLGMEVGQLDLFEGSPPCSSFSQAGTSKSGQFADTRGKVKLYSAGIKQATDDLFLEWLRLVEGLRPKAIIAENVPDMLKGGEARKFTFAVQASLNELGYKVWAKVFATVNAGVATTRRRLVFMGVRDDLGIEVPQIRLTRDGYTLKEALATLPVESPQDEVDMAWQDGRTGYPQCDKPDTCDHYKIDGRCAYQAGFLWHKLKPGEWDEKRITLGRARWDRPCPTITATGANTGACCIMHPDECRKFTPTEIKWISGFPADFILTGTPKDRYERIGRAVPPPLYEEVGRHLANALRSTR